MKIRFYIEKRIGEDGRLQTKERPVFMTVSFHGRKVLFSSGKKIDAEWWDASKQRVKEEHPEALVYNSWFGNMKATASAAWKAVSGTENPDPDSFREVYNMLKPRFSSSFFDVYFQFMEEGSQRWNKATYNKVRTIYKHLREFEEVQHIKLTFKKMNSEFLTEFRNFYRGKGNKEVTTLKAVNTLVWFLNWATDKRYNVFNEYRSFYRELNIGREKTTREPEIFLDWEELLRLNSFKTDEPKKQRARDLFCFMCFTGLRYSELQSLRKEQVTDDRIVVSKKGGKGRIVPLNNYSAEIFRKYENKYYKNSSALPVMSLVTFNKYIRIITKEAGLKEKSGYLSASSASLTFIMSALELDIPSEIISTFTGVNADRRIKILKQKMAKKEMEKFNKRN